MFDLINKIRVKKWYYLTFTLITLLFLFQNCAQFEAQIPGKAGSIVLPSTNQVCFIGQTSQCSQFVSGGIIYGVQHCNSSGSGFEFECDTDEGLLICEAGFQSDLGQQSCVPVPTPTPIVTPTPSVTPPPTPFPNQTLTVTAQGCGFVLPDAHPVLGTDTIIVTCNPRSGAPDQCANTQAVGTTSWPYNTNVIFSFNNPNPDYQPTQIIVDGVSQNFTVNPTVLMTSSHTVQYVCTRPPKQFPLELGTQIRTDVRYEKAGSSNFLILQLDGNLCLYKNSTSNGLWCSGTSGQINTTFFQGDGNLVIYRGVGSGAITIPNAIFSSRTDAAGAGQLDIEGDGLVIRRSCDGRIMWRNGVRATLPACIGGGGGGNPF